MGKMKKRLISLGLVFAMTLSLVPALGTMTFAAGTITVDFSVCIRGEIAEANDGSAMAWREVTVEDLNSDGKYTYEEALIAAHKAYNTADGFHQTGGFVDRLWGENTSACLFFADMNPITESISDVQVNQGDVLEAAILTDTSTYSDWYSSFDCTLVETLVTYEDPIPFWLEGYPAMSFGPVNPVAIPDAEIWVKYEDEPYYDMHIKTDDTGKFELYFPRAGTYVITAKGVIPGVSVYDYEKKETVSVDAPLIAPVCVVKAHKATDAGWHKIGDNWYYIDDDGRVHEGWLIYNDKWYYMDPNTGIMVTGLLENNDEWYCFAESGAMIIGWGQFKGNWYYADPFGVLATGWLKLQNTWYYLDPVTHIMATGWVKSGNSWYYMDASGAMKTGWVKDHDKWYFMDPSSGAMKTGWVQVDRKWYYMDSYGAMKTGWVKSGSSWYFMNPYGAMVTGWVKVDNKWYYMDLNSGAMKTGWLLDKNKWYYLNASGDMAVGWVKSNNKWYYMDTSGVMQIGWVTDNNKKYYMKPDGSMATGWISVDGKRYYLKNSGEMAIGWTLIDNSWYYMDYDGTIHTGWLHLDGLTYFLNESGKMLVGWRTIQSVTYFFKASGAMAQSEWYKGYRFDSDGGWRYKYTGSWVINAQGKRFKDTSGWYAKNETLKIDEKFYTFNSQGYTKD